MICYVSERKDFSFSATLRAFPNPIPAMRIELNKARKLYVVHV
jgi:uncharacterized protein YcgL (UPF0745 family)